MNEISDKKLTISEDIVKNVRRATFLTHPGLYATKLFVCWSILSIR